MSMRRRSTLVLAALAILLALAASPVGAGGAATVDVMSGLDAPPVAGEDREVRVLLLQHGVTPVDFGAVTMTGVLPETGQSVSTAATSIGGGTWTATVAFPTAGDWQLRVTHDELATPDAVALTVAEPRLSLALIAVPIAGIAVVGLVLVLAVLGMRRSPSSARGGASTEPSLHRG